MEDKRLQLKSGRERVLNFSLSFVKALSHSGYYSSEHPLAQKAFQGLYAQFLELIGDRQEMTFFRLEEEQSQDILLEGLFDEPVKMSKLMTAQSGELFIPRLYQYFVRKKILSFTLKNSIQEQEFTSFITLLSEAPEADAVISQQEKELFNMKLIDAGVINISLLFEQDVIGRDRKLPWRVEMALTRLKRDLRFLPLYKNVTAAEMAVLKKKVFHDIIRPLRKSGVLKDFLLHSDLLQLDSETYQGPRIEDAIIEQIPEAMIPEIVQHLLKDWDIAEQNMLSENSEIHRQIVARFREVTKNLAIYFKGKSAPEHYNTLRLLLSKNIISLQDLPQELVQEMMIKEWLEEFLDAPNNFFMSAKNSPDFNRYSQSIKKLVAIFPLLINRGELEAASKIMVFFKEQFKAAPDPNDQRTIIIRNGLQEISRNTSMFDDLKDRFCKAEREERDQVLGILRDFKQRSVPLLLDILRESDKKSVRRQIIDVLVSYQKATIPFIKAVFDDPTQPWFVLRNAIVISAELGDPSLINSVHSLLQHDQVQVRAEALETIAKFHKSDALDILFNALSDKEMSIKLKTIEILGSLAVTTPNVLDYYGQYLLYPAAPDESEHEAVQLHILKALEKIPGNTVWKEGETIVQLLQKILAEDGSTSSFKKLLLKRKTRTPKIIAAIKLTLQKIRS